MTPEDPNAISEKHRLAWEIARECGRAGLTYEHLRRIFTNEASAELRAEYEQHKYRARQLIASKREMQP